MKKNLCIVFCLIFPVFLCLMGRNAQAEPPFKTYYVSLISDESHMRTGPGYRYPIEWLYTRQHMPFLVIDSFDHWRQVKDYKGTIGWFHKKLLSTRKTAIVIRDKAILRKRATLDSEPLAETEKGVVAFVEECSNKWCYLSFSGTEMEGWLYEGDLWGALN